MTTAPNPERYLRQIIVRDFGGEAQAKLAHAHIAIVGLGGIGSPAALYLAAAGIGQLTVFEDDDVSISNLHRQVLYTETDVGASKSNSATARLLAQNPDITITNSGRFTNATQTKSFDLMLDGSDNLATRHLVSRFCVQNNIALLTASLAQWEGQIGHFHPSKGGGCFHCMTPESTDASSLPSCAEAGIIGPVAGVVGTMAALEATKIIANVRPMPAGEVLLYDGAYRDMRTLKVAPRNNCPNCA